MSEPNIQPVDTGSTDTILTVDTSTDESTPGALAPGEGVTDTSDVTGISDVTDENSGTPLETYADFNLPEGIELDKAALDSAIPIMKESGLNQEQAQKFVDWYASQVQAGNVRQSESFNQLMTEWSNASMKDAEFGGDKFEESVAIARTALDKFGTPELKKLMNDHGVGNHPEMIRFMLKVGRLTMEDVPGTGDHVPVPEKDHVAQLYPNKQSA